MTLKPNFPLSSGSILISNKPSDARSSFRTEEIGMRGGEEGKEEEGKEEERKREEGEGEEGKGEEEKGEAEGEGEEKVKEGGMNFHD